MYGNFIHTWGWSSMLWWFVFVLGACSGHKYDRRLDDVAGSISIDCGMPQDSGYIDDITEIPYSSDAKFIDSGVNSNITPEFMPENLHKSLMDVRSFPLENRNCYTLSPPEGRDTTYLIRAWFMYGNYDGQDRLPEFDLYVGVNKWDSVKFDNASHVVIKEITHAPLMDNIYVCLLKTASSTPFISALELRHFHDSTYKPQSGSLVLYKRLDVGSTSNKIVRFKEDALDRIWFPYNIPRSLSINSSSAIDSLDETEYKLPSVVMQTAACPDKDSVSLDIEFPGDPTLDFYVYMHFAELHDLQINQYREFDITLNGHLWGKSVVPKYLRSTTINGTGSVRGSTLAFSLYKTPNSTLPPILNAIEIYVVKDFLQAPTNGEEVNAIMDVKSTYKVDRSWQGDPCLPIYSWDGLNCSYNGYDPPTITSLNLSSSGLTGSIYPELSNLKSLQFLDLSNNSLTGVLPDFLSELPYLRKLNVEGNKLSGSVPSPLMERSKNGSLSLSVGGNPDMCQSDPCKKPEKNFVILIIIIVVSSIVLILFALVILWKCKRKQGSVVKSHKDEEGSLKSENRHFTYAEVVSITNNFQTVIGKGGFGTVYHGRLYDGTQIAVKMLSQASNQGSKQFRTEAQLLMRVHHRNLASLVGYCNEGTNIGIIYEYMANGNLEEHLPVSDKSRSVLSWRERLQIAVDAAQGLEYLHHGCKPPIIHRDVKTANILLNEKMQAKIADFGFSRCFPTETEAHLSTTVVGTLGYLDPEYYTSNRLNEKSDVYSFGVVLMELITGQPAIIRSRESNTHIAQWASSLLRKGDITSIVDGRLGGQYDTNSVWKAMEIAMACVPSLSIQRPTMTNVLTELKECLEIETESDHNAGRSMERQFTRSKHSFEIHNLSYEELEMGPQAR